MKSTVITGLAAAFCLICSPLFLIKNEVLPVSAPASDTSVQKVIKSETDVFRIKTESGIKLVKADEYVAGVLCGEVSPLFDGEALKAQAVAAYTFALRRASYAKSIDRDYDLTDDPSLDQCYVDKNAAKEKWGDKFDEYYKKIEKAVKAVSGQWLCYDGSVALTVYHAASSGTTNSSEDVWGTALPYLVPVDSVGDKLSSDYLSEASFSAEELKEKLGSLCEITDTADALKDIKKAKSGLVLSLKAGEKTIKGTDLAAALSLKSATFDLEYENGVYRFTVYGRGHGVGMSQTGANYMAKQGSDYKEILLHYYKGCELKKT